MCKIDRKTDPMHVLNAVVFEQKTMTISCNARRQPTSHGLHTRSHFSEHVTSLSVSAMRSRPGGSSLGRPAVDAVVSARSVLAARDTTPRRSRKLTVNGQCASAQRRLRAKHAWTALALEDVCKICALDVIR